MTGLRILHVNPRLTGSIRNWSGKDDPTGSWLINHAKNMGFNAIWFSPMHKTTNIKVTKDGQELTGSLYAARDHFQLDDEFSAAPCQLDKNKQDQEHLLHFSRQAKEQGISVIGDLVCNHVAADHPLVIQENKDIETIMEGADDIEKKYHNGSLIGISFCSRQKKPLPGSKNQGTYEYYFKFGRDEDLTVLVAGNDTELWDDVAPINYNSPAAIDFFVHGRDGEEGFWKKVIDWHFEQGFNAFRCDAAYLIPPQVWSELTQYAHDQKKDVVFIAETLGGNDQNKQLENARINIDGEQRPAFDMSMLSTYWWDFKEPWLIHENDFLQKVSLFGGAGFPDNHDTPDTVAGNFKKLFSAMAQEERQQRIADICVRNYAVAALITNSLYMQLGYEYCRNHISVFKGAATYEDWKALIQTYGHDDHPYNLTKRIRAINDFKSKIDMEKSVVRIDPEGYVDEGNSLLKIMCSLYDHQTRDKTGNLVLYINEKPENGPVTVKKHNLWDDKDCLHFGRHYDDKNSDKYEIADIAAYYVRHDGAAAPEVCSAKNRHVAVPQRKP